MPPRNSDDIFELLAEQQPTDVVVTPLGTWDQVTNIPHGYHPGFQVAVAALEAQNPNKKIDVKLLQQPLAPTIVKAIEDAEQTTRFR